MVTHECEQRASLWTRNLLVFCFPAFYFLFSGVWWVPPAHTNQKQGLEMSLTQTSDICIQRHDPRARGFVSKIVLLCSGCCNNTDSWLMNDGHFLLWDQGAGLVEFCWGTSSGLQTADFSLHPHMAGNGEEVLWDLLRGHKSCTRVIPPSWTDHLQKVLPPDSISLELGFQRMNLEKTQIFHNKDETFWYGGEGKTEGWNVIHRETNI